MGGANHIKYLSGYGDRGHRVGVGRFIKVGRVAALDRPTGQLGKFDRYEGPALPVG